jgi:hypothetical protein
MTNIEKIKQARKELDALILEISALAERRLRVPKLHVEALRALIGNFAYAQAEALRQATEVADENFDRAQKLSEQVQENVRHIERLAGERGEVFTAVVSALDEITTLYTSLAACGDCGNWDAEAEPEVMAARAALALAKGEAV